MSDLETAFAGQRLLLCPERAAFRPERGELLLADVHVGKAAAFRRAGRPIPPGTTRRELARIDALLRRLGARRLTLLGDLFHDEVEPGSPTARTFTEWLSAGPAEEVTLVRGNHDRHAVELIQRLPLQVVEEPWPVLGLDYRHHPGGPGPSSPGTSTPGFTSWTAPTARGCRSSGRGPTGWCSPRSGASRACSSCARSRRTASSP